MSDFDRLESLMEDCSPEEREYFWGAVHRATVKARERILDGRVDHVYQPVTDADLDTEEGLEAEAIAACKR